LAGCQLEPAFLPHFEAIKLSCVETLKHADQHHLNASQGWLSLGDLLSANDELEEITPELRANPAVLAVRYEIYSQSKKWEGAAEIAGALVKILPEQPASWICLAYASRRKTGGGIQQAKEILSEAKAKFPMEYLISFNLACYECQLGNLQAAKERLREAIELAGAKKDIRQQALDDPDLKPLWKDIGNI
jgi:predicted Zn-dependent protease